MGDSERGGKGTGVLGASAGKLSKEDFAEFLASPVRTILLLTKSVDPSSTALQVTVHGLSAAVYLLESLNAFDVIL